MNSIKLQNIFRDLFVAYGVSEELSSDGGPQFMADSFQQFLKLWGVRHRLSSVSYPQSNGRAEAAVKSAKRIIHNNISVDGSLNNERAAQAILQHRNTPLQDIGLSPAQILLHRQLRDSIPSHPSHYKLHKDWIITAEQREKALSNRNHLLVEKYNCKARELLPFGVGTNVVVQGPDKKWNRTGKIVETLPNRQYRIRMFHSGRVTLRNRQSIGQYKPVTTLQVATPSPIFPPSPPVKQGTFENCDNYLEREHDNSTTPTVFPTEPSCDSFSNDLPKAKEKIPRALKNLLPYNKPGLKK